MPVGPELPSAVSPRPASPPDAREALARGVAFLRAQQAPDGWWKAPLDTNVTMDAEDLLMREFLGVRTERETAAAARWIRSQQRPDGTWATFHGGPGDLSTTAEAWVALRLAGDPADAAHMREAAAFVLDGGGLEASRVFTRIWLALFGLWSWDDVPAMVPEAVLLPKWFPLNLYDFACWARQTIAPLTIVGAYRPQRPLPVGVDELRRGGPIQPPRRSLRDWPGRLGWLDHLLHRYERHPVGPLRRMALDRAERWIVARQEADGSWGGIQPPWVYSLMALSVRGYPNDHPVMRAGLAGLDTFIIEEGDQRRLEACQSPVWDTALAMIALADAGVPPDDEDLARAARWTLAEEVRVRGDWAVRRPALEPGGWAFEFANDNYPDIDDTAEVVLALRRTRLGEAGADAEPAIRRGIDWAIGMQSNDGGWGAFDADNTRELCVQLPFCDFGAVIDPPSADVTAHVVEMLALEGRASDPAAQRGIRWLLDAQEADGSWFGRWGINHVYGTGAVVPALVAAGIPAGDPAIRRAVDWLGAHQNADGGWGEDARSYVDPAWIGRGQSTASQTAWALLALEAAGERDGDAVARGVAWLAASQRPDGGWDEPQFTGTGFPGDFYINYGLYRQVFPLMALGRCLR
ncbi:squalene--hopene cyclase [Capillimicrobium parvum]|uniref:Squalene--hopene cyclase n=1 Tax=Capillimicrobium parvum TaxID=2884022 RepID=A0A9E7C6E1_9ACTN|nr:squalene--hopene cyclase [Capillimicrobium parvum]UGS38772.1 Squalene--hopene cyclase [Capillimicrobium parvum]